MSYYIHNKTGIRSDFFKATFDLTSLLSDFANRVEKESLIYHGSIVQLFTIILNLYTSTVNTVLIV